MEITERLIRQSNEWYNDGLQKAGIRDMSGAIASLHKSLQLNRENINARNLLGLVYYGRGEVAEALVQWIISKNFKSYENIANYYINKVQESPVELEAMNQAIHKYNQCLTYCRQNGEDLAIIQLKKIVATQPSFLKAQQLLALLFITTGQYPKARQVLRTAYKLDVTNDITLRYMNELQKKRGNKVAHLKEEPKADDHSVTYRVGNETIIQPVSASLKDNAAIMTILNIVIGIAMGVLVMWFLVVPTINQKKSVATNQSVINLSEQVAAQNTQIDTLKEELATYRETSSEAETAIQTAASTRDSYEKVIWVKDLMDGGNTSNADMMEILLQVNEDALGDQGMALYQELTEDLYPTMCSRLFKSAESEYESGNYVEAKTDIDKVVRMNYEYEEGAALKLQADVYNKLGEKEKAKKIYEAVISGFAGTGAAEEAINALNELNAEQ